MTPPVICYGATGYTGRLAVRALLDRGADVALAGRSRRRLQDLRSDLDVDADVRPAAADDPVGLARVLDDASAVVNTAGPFLKVGDGVARAALQAGVPYVDSTGEQVFVKQLVDDLDDRARDAGVPVVPMMAFEYAPGDLCAALLLEGRPAASLDVAYKVDHGVATEGTRRSIVEVATRTGYVRGGGRLVEEPPATRTREFAFDDRDLAAYSFPAGEVLTVPAHQEVDDLVGYMVAHPRTIRRLRMLGPVARGLVRGPVRDLVEALAVLGHEDPHPDQRRDVGGRVLLVAAFEDGGIERYGFACRDPYALTGEMLAEGAIGLAGGDADGGVVAPSEVFDPEGLLQAVRKRHPPVAWGPGPPELPAPSGGD